MIENPSEKFLVELFFECRDAKRLPYGGTSLDQTAFLKESFALLEGLTQEYIQREQVKAEEEQRRLSNRT